MKDIYKEIERFKIEHFQKTVDNYINKEIEEEKKMREQSEEMKLVYTDEMLEWVCASIRKDIERMFNKDLMEHHKTELPDGTDISKELDSIRDASTEKLIILYYDKNDVLQSKTFDQGTEGETLVSIKDITKFLLENDIEKFATVHNHPSAVSALFSNTDTRFDYQLRIAMIFLKIELLDIFVVTKFDTVSRHQLETSGKENHQNTYCQLPVIHPVYISDKLEKQLAEENRMAGDLLKFTIKYANKEE